MHFPTNSTGPDNADADDNFNKRSNGRRSHGPVGRRKSHTATEYYIITCDVANRILRAQTFTPPSSAAAAVPSERRSSPVPRPVKLCHIMRVRVW